MVLSIVGILDGMPDEKVYALRVLEGHRAIIVSPIDRNSYPSLVVVAASIANVEGPLVVRMDANDASLVVLALKKEVVVILIGMDVAVPYIKAAANEIENRVIAGIVHTKNTREGQNAIVQTSGIRTVEVRVRRDEEETTVSLVLESVYRTGA